MKTLSFHIVRFMICAFAILHSSPGTAQSGTAIIDGIRLYFENAAPVLGRVTAFKLLRKPTSAMLAGSPAESLVEPTRITHELALIKTSRYVCLVGLASQSHAVREIEFSVNVYAQCAPIAAGARSESLRKIFERSRDALFGPKNDSPIDPVKLESLIKGNLPLEALIPTDSQLEIIVPSLMFPVKNPSDVAPIDLRAEIRERISMTGRDGVVRLTEVRVAVWSEPSWCGGMFL